MRSSVIRLSSFRSCAPLRTTILQPFKCLVKTLGAGRSDLKVSENPESWPQVAEVALSFAVASRASFRSPPLASSFSWLTLLRRTAPSTSCLRRSATESDSPCPSFQVWGRYVWAPRPKTCTPQDLCRRHPKLMFWQAMGLSLGLKNRCKDGECHHAGVSPRCTCKRRSATQKTSALELPAAGSQGKEE